VSNEIKFKSEVGGVGDFEATFKTVPFSPPGPFPATVEKLIVALGSMHDASVSSSFVAFLFRDCIFHQQHG
jgi:hypothetical protein